MATSLPPWEQGDKLSSLPWGLSQVPGVIAVWPSLSVHPWEFSHPYCATVRLIKSEPGAAVGVISHQNYYYTFPPACTFTGFYRCLQVLAAPLCIYLVFGCGAVICPCISGFFVQEKPLVFSSLCFIIGNDLSESKESYNCIIYVQDISEKIAISSAHILKLSNTLINNQSINQRRSLKGLKNTLD